MMPVTNVEVTLVTDAMLTHEHLLLMQHFLVLKSASETLLVHLLT
jgi:hypothetical protein